MNDVAYLQDGLHLDINYEMIITVTTPLIVSLQYQKCMIYEL